MEKKVNRSEVIRKLFDSLSAREKKIVRTELFGGSYPNEDLSDETCLKIIARLRPSAREKLKPYKIIRHLVDHFAILDRDQFEIYDDTITEAERANRVLNAINIKSSYSIAVLYISLIDSSNEEDGPPTHHQLAYELKRIVKEECTNLSLTMPDTPISVAGSSSVEVLENIITDLTGIVLTVSQKTIFVDKLGIVNEDEPSNDLLQLLKAWIAKRGQWCTQDDIVEAILLTPSIGRHVSKLKLPPFLRLKEFLSGLGDNWIRIAIYIGFSKSELSIASDDDSAQLDVFLSHWSMPDCGQKTVVILQKLKNVVIPVAVRSSAGNKAYSGLSLSSDESTPLDSTTVSLTLQPVTTNELTLLTPSDMLTVTTPTLSTQSVFDNTLSTTTNTTLTTTVTTDYLSDIVSLPEVPKIRRNRRLPATDDQSNDFDKKETSIPQQKKPLSAPLDYQLSSTTPTSIENSFTSLPNIASPPTASYVNKPSISSLPNLVKSPIRSLPVVGGSSLQPNVSFLKSSSLKLNVMKYDFHQHNGVESKPLKASQTDTATDSSEVKTSDIADSPAVITTTDESWPQPIQQTLEPTQLESVAVFTTNAQFSTPVAVTNTTWTSDTPSLKSGAMYWTSRSQTNEEPNKSVSCNSEEVETSQVPHIVETDSSSSVLNGSSSIVDILKDDENENYEFCSSKLINLLLNSSEELFEYLRTLDNSVDEVNKPVPLEYLQYGWNPLHIAVKLDLVDHVDALVHAGANVNLINEKTDGISVLHIVAESGNLDMMHTLTDMDSTDVNIRDSTGSTPLLTACRHSKPQCVSLLLNSGANIEAKNDHNETPLFISVENGSVEIVTILLSRQPQPNINHIKECMDINGKVYIITPVVEAAAKGHIEILQLFQEKGADLNCAEVEEVPPDNVNGIFSPVALACYNGQKEIVQYIIQQDNINLGLPFIADCVVIALRGGNVECAMLIWDNYGGMQKLLEDSDGYNELNRCLLQFSKELLKPDTITVSLNQLTASLEVATNDDITLNDLSTCEDTHDDDLHTEETQKRKKYTKQSPKHTKIESKVTTASPQAITSTATPTSIETPIISSAPTYTSTDISIPTIPTISTGIVTTTPPSLEPTNAFNNLSEAEDSATQSVTYTKNFEIEEKQFKSLNPSAGIVEGTGKLTFGGVTQTEYQPDEPISNGATGTSGPVRPRGGASNFDSDNGSPHERFRSDGRDIDSDDLFTPRPKSPPLPHSPHDSDVPTEYLFSDSAEALRTFQSSAIELLHDFAQYLILACLQRYTQEDIIRKAEAIGESALVQFFSRYFYDVAGAARGSEFVAEFIRGFPSPLNFLLSAQFCTKGEFLSILKDIGRPEFPDQLMLALHQFPNSDNIPWSGAELLNSMFRQQFSMGTPFPVSAMQSRSQPRPSLPPPVTTSSSQSSLFPGSGNVLGYRDTPAVTTSVQTVPRRRVATDNSNINNLDAPTQVTMSSTSPVSLPVLPPVVTATSSSVPSTSTPVVATDVPVIASVPVTLQLTVATSVPVVATPIGSVAQSLPVTMATVPIVTSSIPVVSTSQTLEVQSIALEKDQQDEDVSTKSLSLQEVLKSSSDSSSDDDTPTPHQLQSSYQKRLEALSKKSSSSVPPAQFSPRPKTKQPLTSQTQSLKSTIPKSTTKLQPSSTSSLRYTTPSSRNILATKSFTTTSSTAKTRTQTSSTHFLSSPATKRTLFSTKTKHSGTSKAAPGSSPTVKSKTGKLQPKKEPTTSKVVPSNSKVAKSPPTVSKLKHNKVPTNQIDKEKIVNTSHELVVLHSAKRFIVKEHEKVHALSLTPIPSLVVPLPAIRIAHEMGLFKIIAANINNWKMLGRYLLVEDKSIEVIAMIGNDSCHQALQMLLLWSTQLGENATYLVLGEALCNCRRDDLVDAVVKHSQDPSIEMEEETDVGTIDSSDITLTVPVDKVWVNLKPFIESRQKSGTSKVTLSLKFD